MRKHEWPTDAKDERLTVHCSGSIVTTDPEETLAAHRRFLSAIHAAALTPGITEVAYDLDACLQIDPGGILLLFHAGQIATPLGLRVFIWRSRPSAAYEVVAENIDHLVESLGGKKAKGVRQDRKYLLRSIPDKSTMVEEIENWATTLKGMANADPEDVARWQMQIAEVATNTFQHSRAEKLLVVGDAYPASVQLAAIDFGQTIPTIIGPTAEKLDRSGHDGQLIALACEKGVTSQCVRQNQGAGLHSLVETVKENNGRVQILSRKGLFHLSNRRRYRRKLATHDARALRGTLVVINFRL